MYEEVFGVLALAALAGAECAQLVRKADDPQIQVAHGDAVHAGQAGIIDVVEDVHALGYPLQHEELVRIQIRRLGVEPADMIAGGMDIEGVGRAAADDELLPPGILVTPGTVILSAGVESVPGLGQGSPELAFAEDIIRRLLAHIHEAHLAERDVQLAPVTVVVVEYGVIRSGGYLPAPALLVAPGDVVIDRLEAEVIADLLGDAVSEDVQLGLGELAVRPDKDPDAVGGLGRLHLRSRLPGRTGDILQQVWGELPGYPVQGLRKCQMLLPLHQLYGSVCLGVRSALVLEEPHAFLEEDRG